MHKCVRLNHDAMHSMQKGSATHTTTGTTYPPPTPSVAHCREWSIGKVLDVYWHFSEPGDTCLGRMLAGYDPNNSSFIIDNPMQDKNLNEEMNWMCSPILAQWKDTPSNLHRILLLFLASVIYYEKWIKEQISKNTNYDFMKIPVINNNNLLNYLRNKISTEPSNVMQCAMGIPPHVKTTIAMHK